MEACAFSVSCHATRHGRRETPSNRTSMPYGHDLNAPFVSLAAASGLLELEEELQGAQGTAPADKLCYPGPISLTAMTALAGSDRIV